jgi:uncharacterized membrane protein
LGLGIVFVWIGVDILYHPDNWIGFVPPELPFGTDRHLALRINGMMDVGLGILLILGLFMKLVSALAAFHLIGILLGQGIDAVLIRDVGLLGAALALFFWPKNHHH